MERALVLLLAGGWVVILLGMLVVRQTRGLALAVAFLIAVVVAVRVCGAGAN